MSRPAEQIVAVGQWMFERRLTDIAGGNLSIREHDRIFVTPTAAGQKWRWQLDPMDILCARLDTDELLQHPQHSKESLSHLAVYRAFPEVNAIIHAHPFHVMPFCATGKPIQALIPAVQRCGPLEYIPDAPFYSQAQADLIVQNLQAKRARIAEWATGVLLPKHGVFVVGKNIDATLDCLERIDNAAYCTLATKLIE